jgi:threonine dehydrogenase-like Zn-dependent dehydrogenase
MLATMIYGPRDIRLENVDDPVLASGTGEGGEPASGRDAIVRIVASCVCGSDLWPYRGVTETDEPRAIGHEFVGVVEQTGTAVSRVAVGDFVISPFYDCDMTCVNCLNGVSSSCLDSNWWGRLDREGFRTGGAQAGYIRVPHADGTLVVVPAPVNDALVPHLLALSDVMATGHHAAVSAGVGPNTTVAVVGDGAVGLCAVIAAKRLGATRIVMMSRHPDRQALATRFGATDIVEQRGDDGVAAIKTLFDDIGPDAVLECVGTAESMDQAIRSVRPGGMVGYVGVPHGGAELPIRTLFSSNVGVNGGVAPVRNYIDELLPDVLAGTIEPGLVFDCELPLANVVEAYTAMDERRAIKVLLRP